MSLPFTRNHHQIITALEAAFMTASEKNSNPIVGDYVLVEDRHDRHPRSWAIGRVEWVDGWDVLVHHIAGKWKLIGQRDLVRLSEIRAWGTKADTSRYWAMCSEVVSEYTDALDKAQSRLDQAYAEHITASAALKAKMDEINAIPARDKSRSAASTPMADTPEEAESIYEAFA